jgi:hypothetical protein
MNLTKNMEALFLVAAILTCASAFASIPRASTPAQRVSAYDEPVPAMVVVVSAKRLTASEKAQLAN